MLIEYAYKFIQSRKTAKRKQIGYYYIFSLNLKGHKDNKIGSV
jgi:hypothetical protein